MRHAPIRVLVTGALAIDHIGHYPGAFSALPRHRGINLSVRLDRVDRRFGGCAMNIAYTLKVLGDDPAPFVFVGEDFDARYAAHLEALGMDVSGVNRTSAPYCAQAFVFTDQQDNQFTAFFGGPSPKGDSMARLGPFVAKDCFAFAVLAPDMPANMIAAAQVMRAGGIPFLADPGQNITDFRAADAAKLVRSSRTVIVNEFEHETLRRLVGDDALAALDLLVVTRGERGACWRSRTEGHGHEPAVAARMVDPTGCGDAFRGGFVHARLRGAGVRVAVRAGGVAAAEALRSIGTQTHRCDNFAESYRAAWGEDMETAT